jgi:hypothetical protein
MPQFLQRSGHVRGVVHGIGQMRRMLVSPISNHQRHARLGVDASGGK